MTRTALRIGVVAWLACSWAVPAHAQDPLNRHVISLCAECDDLQKQVIERLLILRDVDRALEEARRRSLCKNGAERS